MDSRFLLSLIPKRVYRYKRGVTEKHSDTNAFLTDSNQKDATDERANCQCLTEELSPFCNAGAFRD